MSDIKRIALMSAGFLFVTLGTIGTFLPVMPAIPFFIIASICFSKSSKRFHNMLLNNRWIGSHIRKYHEKNGVELKTKVLFVVFQWIGVLFTFIFLIHNFFSRILLVVLALAGSIYILSLKTVE